MATHALPVGIGTVGAAVYEATSRERWSVRPAFLLWIVASVLGWAAITGLVAGVGSFIGI